MNDPQMGDPAMDYLCNWKDWKLIYTNGYAQIQKIEAWIEYTELDKEFY